jgi:hypothetical protein
VAQKVLNAFAAFQDLGAAGPSALPFSRSRFADDSCISDSSRISDEFIDLSRSESVRALFFRILADGLQNFGLWRRQPHVIT